MPELVFAPKPTPVSTVATTFPRSLIAAQLYPLSLPPVVLAEPRLTTIQVAEATVGKAKANAITEQQNCETSYHRSSSSNKKPV